jgi:hypothetical protein
MTFLRSVFYSTYLRVGIYIVIGIGVNTAAPHYPTFSSNFTWHAELHSLAQYIISVGLWPLSLWSPTFTVGKWTGL